MTLIVRPGILYDADALAYMELVKAADAAAGQAGGLEQGVVDAINDFVVGCKTDGIWSAIKASCILSGARTLAGALIPLAGTAPTNVSFVSGDYNRKTGLVGNGSTKYLDTNRNNNADPQNSQHMAVYAGTVGTAIAISVVTNAAATGASFIGLAGIRSRNDTADLIAMQAGFNGISRNNSSTFTHRVSSSTTTFSRTSQTPADQNLALFNSGVNYGTHRLAFYSIGESLNLAALDARVSALITAFGVAIP